MLILEFILIAIGLLAVVFSFRMSEYSSIGSAEQPLEENDGDQGFTLNKEDRDAFLGELEEAKEEAVQNASDEMSRLSNDKLMGMDEYSNQVLEKIAKNHEEVVFLYNMLGEKEDEIKKLIQHVDSVTAQIHDEVAGEYQKMAQVLKLINKKKEMFEESIMELENVAEATEDAMADVIEDTMTDVMEEALTDVIEEAMSEAEANTKTVEENMGDAEKERWELNAAYDEEVRAIERAEEQEQPQPQYFPKKSPKKKEKKAVQENHNAEILDLHKKGHSVLEISRMLSLGQGEVKFVIDLEESRKEATYG